MGQYRGHVADVDIHLWRGAYTLKQLVIEKASGKVPVPLLDAPVTDIAISWRALLHGGIVARVHFEHPELTLVDGRGGEETQSGRGVDWRAQLERLVPIRLDELGVSNGVVRFRNFTSNPPVDIHATDVDASVENLTNVRDEKGSRPAVLTATGNILDGAALSTQARFDPLADFNEFELDLKVERIDLTRLNDVFRAYAALDVKSGAGDLVLQLEAKQGRISGYAKPLFRDLDLIDFRKDAKNPLRLAWEALAAAVISVVKNRKENQLATRIDFGGTIADPKVDTLDAILGILHNAFVRALGPDFETIKSD